MLDKQCGRSIRERRAAVLQLAWVTLEPAVDEPGIGAKKAKQTSVDTDLDIDCRL